MQRRRSCNAPPHFRQPSRARERRQRLLAEAVARHGVAVVAAFLTLLEAEFGEEIGINRRLEFLIDADPAALALITGRPPP